MASLAATCLYETLDFAFSTPTPTPSAPSSPYTVYRNEITDAADPAAAAVPVVEYFSLLPSPPDTPRAAHGEASPVASSPGPVAGGGDGDDGVETNRAWFRAGSRIRSPMLQLHKEIVDFVEFVSPTPEEKAARTAAIQSVSEVIKYIWPHCIVEVFGSFRTGLYLPTSDIDVVILESKVTKPQTGLYALARALSQRSIAKKMQVIAKARVPIVKFVEKRSGIAFDISFDIENGPKAADFIKDALKKIPPLRPLCMVLKVFLQQRELNEVFSGGIGSYALLAMLIANLQTYRSPQDLQLGQQPMEHNLGILLVNFFEFYGRKLNTTDVGVSCNSAGTFFLKRDKGFSNTERPYLLSIEDPQAPENDIGKSSFNYYKRTWERAKQASSLDHVVVATDDEKIAECCRRFGADVIMTSESCSNGTERCNEALLKLQKTYDIVVNIQGDEPLIDPEIIDGVVKALQGAPDAVFSTAVTALKPEDGLDPNRVKCVVDNNGYAIYFSRGLIPYNKQGKVNPRFPYLLHLGIQSYDSKFLRIYPQLPPTPLQLEEDLEQLKVLENGYKMKVIKVNHDAHGVDTPEDVEKIEALMRQRNIS